MKKIKINGTKEIIYEHQLSNGLKIYMWPYKKAKECYMTLTVKYGSIHTEFKVNNNIYNVPHGMAHFLEHVKFNEKKGLTAHEYFNKIGSYTNAYTTFDHTSYEVICTNEVNKNLEHLLYFVLNPYFTKQLIEKEKPIIVEESKMTQKNPYNIGYFKLLNNIFNASNKRFLVTGKEDDINSITLKDVEDTFKNFYSPNNMFLTVTGNFLPEDIVNTCEKYFKNKNYPKVKTKIIEDAEKDNVTLKKDKINVNVNKPKSNVVLKINKKYLPKYEKRELSILLNLLLDINFSETSLFYDKLLTSGKIDYLSYRATIENNHIILSIETSCDNPDVVNKLIVKKLQHLSTNKKDFNRKIKTYLASSIMGYDDVNEVNNAIRRQIIKYDKVLNDYHDTLKQLSNKDIENIIKSIKYYDIATLDLLPLKKSS